MYQSAGTCTLVYTNKEYTLLSDKLAMIEAQLCFNTQIHTAYVMAYMIGGYHSCGLMTGDDTSVNKHIPTMERWL